MRIDVITLFPELVQSVVQWGVVSRAAERELLQLSTRNPRDYTHDKHRTVDDRPYGGGPGMVMKVQPLRDAIHAAKTSLPNAKVVYLSPQGEVLKQARVEAMAQWDEIILVAGRYEGVDERLIEQEIDLELSIGDYVLSGGELGAMVLIDAITRMIPGALGHQASAQQDSFSDGLLDCPHYTRPIELDGDPVPDVLMQGNHAHIERWRRQQSLGRTWARRPDLLAGCELNETDKQLLAEYIQASNR